MSTPSSSNSVGAKEFTGKRVLVTGGTKGAGKTIADRFLKFGSPVFAFQRLGPSGQPPRTMRGVGAGKKLRRPAQAVCETFTPTAAISFSKLTRF